MNKKNNEDNARLDIKFPSIYIDENKFEINYK